MRSSVCRIPSVKNINYRPPTNPQNVLVNHPPYEEHSWLFLSSFASLLLLFRRLLSSSFLGVLGYLGLLLGRHVDEVRFGMG